MSKIAQVDREAMNELFAYAMKKAAEENPFLTEQVKSDHADQLATEDSVLKEDAKEMSNVKAAAKNEGWTEEAFADHKDYLETLEETLSEDDKESWDPNDVNLD